MDALFQAAQGGDVEKLHLLLAERPLDLHQVPLLCTENPLHFSSAYGHLDFTRELLKLKPDFAGELNPQGYSPLHLASANGRTEIVKEFIRLDPKLCRIRGREAKTPFHLAVVKGRIDVIKDMLAACEGCIEDVSVQRETALHLAVKCCQLGSLQVLVDWVRQMGKEVILNRTDEHGNTILHLAIWKKQKQVLDLLFGNRFAGSLEVNAINKSGLTALDLLLIFPSEAGDREMLEILQGAGASKSQDLATDIPCSASTSNSPSYRSSVLVDYFKFHQGRDSPSDVRSTLLVIAVLVATATYQVGINPPGGTWQDSQGHIAGTSIMGTFSASGYISLVAFNSIGFFVSLYLINALTRKFPFQTELQICLIALYATYQGAVIGTSPKSSKLFTTVFVSILPSAVPLAAFLLRKYGVCGRVACLVKQIATKVKQAFHL